MPHKLVTLLALLTASAATANTFGTVVVIGGHASDIALDQGRGVLYIANFAGKRIDVMSTDNNTLKTPLPVDAEPGSLALSPDGRYLVVAHFVNAAGTSPGITVIDLAANARSVLPIPVPPTPAGTTTPPPPGTPLSVVFGNSSQALLVTTNGIYLVDPVELSFSRLNVTSPATGKIPVGFGTYPPQIVKATAGVSGDGNRIVIAADYSSTSGSTGGGSSGSQTAFYFFDVASGGLVFGGVTSSPPLGPRSLSLNQDATRILTGWALLDSSINLLAEFPYPTGALNVGGLAFDYVRNLIYAQVPVGAGFSTSSTGSGTSSTDTSSTPTEAPVLHVMDVDNLTVRDRIQLAENLGGRTIFNQDLSKLYAISDSGVTVLPVGTLATARRIATVQEDLLFQANNCDNRPVSATLDIVDQGGGRTDFSLSVPSTTKGVSFSQTSGTTPAHITVQVDPTAFRSQTGTTAIPVTITSSGAVNLPPPVRLLVNTREPDQRGAIYNLPGKIVDLLADPVRGRFYALRQDKNEVIVLQQPTMQVIARMKTGNTPTQMAVTRDNRYMIVGNDNSQFAWVLDLDTLQPSVPIVFPGGHYPRSIAIANSAILALSRNVGQAPSGCGSGSSASSGGTPPAMIDTVDFANRVASTTCALGIFTNSVPMDSIMIASPSGGSIFTAMSDGTVLLYDDVYSAFEASRKDLTSLAGSYGAISDDRFAAGNTLFNRSLVATGTVGTAGSALLLGADSAVSVGSTSAASAGVVQRLSLSTGAVIRPARMIEAPTTPTILNTPAAGQIGQTILSFFRPLATMADSTIAVLTISGISILPPGFDNPTPMPVVSSLVNSADGGGVAPGGLITINGAGLSQSSGSAGSLPLPTTLAGICASVNNIAIPLLAVAPDHIDAQLPFEASGNGTLVITAPGGKSTPYTFAILAGAPAIFRTGTVNETTGLPLVYRASNQELVNFSNPLHPGETVVMILTGLGKTSPQPDSGAAAPLDPLAMVSNVPAVTLGGTTLPVAYAGLMPGYVGVYQVHAVVPRDIQSGTQVPLTIQQGSSTTSLPVRVVNP
jgi:uncharacterized protein (TIGR03437 family)